MSSRQDKAVATANAYNQGNIAGLDDAMTRRLIASVVLTESNGGDLDITNSLGYVGRYQAGASWLADADYIDSNKLRTAMAGDGFTREAAWGAKGHMTEFLNDSANWKNGLSLDQYKASAELQDRAFKIISDKAYKQAIREGVLRERDDDSKIAGYLKARHISGPAGARKALEGIAVNDDYQTSNIKYLEDITRNGDGLNQVMNHHREQHFQIQDDRSVGLFKNHEVLRQDKHGADVVKLQTDLRDLGYTDVHGDPLEPDGRFGRNTHHAVENFQRDHDLNADGVVGPNTWAALRNVVRISSVAPTVTQISGQNQQSSQDPVDTSPVYPSDTANQQLVLLQAQVLEMQRQMEAMIRQRELGHEKERGDSFAVSSETPRHAAFDEYTPAQRITWRLGYSDPRHPQHDLYIDVKERLKADGHHLPEDRLTQVVGEMHTRGFQPNWEGYAKVHNDAVYVSDFSPWANRVRVDLKEPAPSVQETLRQVDDHQQTLTQQHALREQQTQSRGHGHSLSP